MATDRPAASASIRAVEPSKCRTTFALTALRLRVGQRSHSLGVFLTVPDHILGFSAALPGTTDRTAQHCKSMTQVQLRDSLAIQVRDQLQTKCLEASVLAAHAPLNFVARSKQGHLPRGANHRSGIRRVRERSALLFASSYF